LLTRRADFRNYPTDFDLGIVRVLYNIAFLTGFVLAAPYYFWRLVRRGNWVAGFGQRFAQYDAKLKQALTNRHPLWLHAVSVGEVGLCAHLIKAIQPRLPNAKLVVSTTTTTGMAQLKKLLPTTISKIYYPIDRRSYVARAQSVVHPEAIVLVEAEIWPNFIWRAQRQRIPLFLVNARVSDRSFPRYKRFGFFFRPLFAAFQGVGAQSATDAQRLIELGCRPEAVRVVGSMKFDAAHTVSPARTLDVAGLLQQAGAKSGAPVLVAGSTHAGEEKLLGEMLLRLRKQFPDLFLVLVPRHFERTREVERELRAAGVDYALRTTLATTATAPAAKHCLVVNTTGELRYFYQHATVVFVGKSLTARGGQNPIEPCALGKATVFGPNMQNFADVVTQLLARDAAMQVPDAAALERTMRDLLQIPARRTQLGQNAIVVVRENLGATERTVEMIVENIDSSGVYVAPKH
jgi:3-deoxy-D-manno-octulosonic-acid transferase